MPGADGSQARTTRNALAHVVRCVVVSVGLPVVAQAQNRYSSDQYGFTIDFPAGWVVKRGTSSGTIAKAVHRDSAGRLAVLCISNYEIDADGDLWDVPPEGMFERFMGDFPGVEAKLVAHGTELLNGQHAQWILIDVESPPAMSMYVLGYHVLRRPSLIRITAMVDRDREWFAQQEPIVRAAMRTFRWAEPQAPKATRPFSHRGDSFVVALFNGYWRTFLAVLVAAVGMGVGKALMSQVRSRRKVASADDEREQGPEEPSTTDPSAPIRGRADCLPKQCPVCQRLSPSSADICADCGSSLTVDVANGRPDNLTPPPRTRGAFIVLGIGLVVFTAGYFISPPSLPAGASPVVRFLDPMITLGIWAVSLGLVALIASALAGRVKRLCFLIFTWLFLAAAVFNILVNGYTEFIVKPQVDSAIRMLDIPHEE